MLLVHAAAQGAVQRADTVAAKLVPPVVQIPDTIVTVSPETTIQWLSGMSAVAVAILAAVAIVVEVVRERRRSAEFARDAAARRAAVDGQISALGYALRRQLQAWLDAAGEASALVAVVDAWTSAVKELGGKEAGEVPGVTEGMIGSTLVWATNGLRDHFDLAEERIVQLVGAAPEASVDVAVAIRRAYVFFYRATGRLRRNIAAYDYAKGGGADAEDLATAYHELEACSETLVVAVGEELSRADRDLAVGGAP